MPKYKISSPDTGRVYYDEADFDTLIRVLEIPEHEILALYTAEVGSTVEFLLKPAHTGFKLFVEKTSE